MADTPVSCAGAILAGGRSERMGGGYKALADLGGTPMIARVIGRLAGQADPLVLSVPPAGDDFTQFGLTLVEDRVTSHRGPLAGLYSVLRHLDESGGPDWLLLCPCDAPFLPRDLARRLLAAAMESQLLVAIAAYGGHPQPTFSAWRRDTLGPIGSAVLERGAGGLMQMLDMLPHTVVEWAAEKISPFFNVNTPAELEQARRWL